MRELWKPARIDYSLTYMLHESGKEVEAIYDPSLQEHIQVFHKKGWRFWAVNQVCGRCYFDKNVITIPAWAFSRGFAYLSWYIAHECAHAFAGWRVHHGDKFMRELIRICPKESIHFETTYKPKQAARAGISALPNHKIVQIGNKRFELNEDELFS